MAEQFIAARPRRAGARTDPATEANRVAVSRAMLAWCGVALCVVAGGLIWVVLTRMRPSFDAFGFLTWGRQVLHWNLNTDGAPSWKPLPFLFTVPYALAGATVQMWLWMVTVSAMTLAGAVFAGRIAYRLSAPAPQRRWAPWVAAAFAGVGVLGLSGYSQQVLIANSDPMLVTLTLAAIDMHLSGRRRLAFLLTVLVSLGRPEAWPFALLYAIWAWRAVPSMRVFAVLGLALIPLGWFLIPGLTSHSWMIAGDLAKNSPNVIHGNKLTGVLGRLRSLYDVPMQLAVVFALGLAIVRRDRVSLLLAGAAAVWVITEIAFALHGWSAVPRYLFEPAAVLIVIAGGAVGCVLGSEVGTRRLLAWAPALPVLALMIALIPSAHLRERDAAYNIRESHRDALVLSRLQAVIKQEGGASQIKSCGQPVSLVGYQAELAWVVGLNVGNVGFRPGRSIDKGNPIVYFKPVKNGWSVRPIHQKPVDVARCAALRVDFDIG
jgi:hypothetical protein